MNKAGDRDNAGEQIPDPNLITKMEEAGGVVRYSQTQWFDLAKQIYDLVMNEVEVVKDSIYLPEIYPRLIICYEFFRLIRGEMLFYTKRPPMLEKQKELYKMEDKISAKLKEISAKLDPKDEKVKFHLDEVQKWIRLF